MAEVWRNFVEWQRFGEHSNGISTGKPSLVASLDCDDNFNDWLRQYFARSLSFVVVMLIDSH